MREIAASEASRNFSAVLDTVQHGETAVVTRVDRRIAPVPAATGAMFNAVLARWRGTAALEHVAAARSAA